MEKFLKTLAYYLAYDKETEKDIIKKIRNQVFKSAKARGLITPAMTGERDFILTFLTFQHCGAIARVFLECLNKHLCRDVFDFHSLKGHYVIISKRTGLMYDLVSDSGTKPEEANKLDYYEYLKEANQYNVDHKALILKYTEKSRLNRLLS